MMRPLLDALSLQSGGGSAHLRELVMRQAPVPTHIITTQSQWAMLSPDSGSWKPVFAPEATRNPFHRNLWRLRHLKDVVCHVNANMFFNPASDACSLPIPQVCMVQNMLPFDRRVDHWHPPGTYTNLRLRILRRRILSVARTAAGVIFLSDWSKERIISLLPHPPDWSRVIPHGVAKLPSTRQGLRPRPEVLYVSDFAPYKHQLEVALAYDICAARGRDLGGLTLAGSLDDRSYSGLVLRQISHLSSRPSVCIPGWLDRKTLAQAYAKADILVIASSVECCPNILLEALSTGKPILCSSEAPMSEFAGDAVVYADPQDPLSLAEGLGHICSMTSSELDALSRKASQRASLYDWDKAISATWDFLQETHAHHPKEGTPCAA